MPVLSPRLCKVLGLSPSRALWGTRPPDFGLCGIKRVAWHAEQDQAHHNEQHAAESFWAAPWYATPDVRHIWGEKQGQLHPGGKELLLDLIFVGVAFRVGEIMKACIYACKTPSAAYSSIGVDDSHGRLLDAAQAELPAGDCLGLGLTLLHSLAPFVCMYSLWDIEKRYRAQFAVSSKLHSTADCLSDFLLIVAAMSMSPANAYREVRDSSYMGLAHGLARVLVPIVCAFFLWMLRIGEIALLASRECARRQSGADLVTCWQILAMWVGAILLSITDFDSPSSNALMSDLAAVLMWIGNLWWIWKPMLRTTLALALPGMLPIERALVCSNAGFFIHRNNEFMFLMLGETVLQIIVAIPPGTVAPGDHPYFNVPVATAGVGFLLAMYMMFFFRFMVSGMLFNYGRTNKGLETQTKETEELLRYFGAGTGDLARPPPGAAQRRLSQIGFKRKSVMTPAQVAPQRRSDRESATGAMKKFVDTNLITGDTKFETKAERIVLHMSVYNMLNSLLWQFNAIAVMVVGIGIKLAITNPWASPTEFYAFPQRAEMSISLAVVFIIQLFHTLMVKTRHHYSWKVVTEQPLHVLVVTVRLAVIATCAFSCVFELRPLIMLITLVGFSATQYTLLQLQEFVFPVESNNQHPMRELPQALFALQQRRKRAAVAARSTATDDDSTTPVHGMAPPPNGWCEANTG